jgi:ornithine cyclodeaminase/alanine dehydrogenase-like protein (mu-crystallin family)
MLVVTPEQTHALAPMPRLIEALRDAFRTGCSAPVRQAASVPGGAGDRVILSMPAFDFYADLVTGRRSGRVSRDEIIMFKSVGAAIEDLAAARLVIGAIRDGGYAGLAT